MKFFYQTNKSRGTAASLGYPIQQSLGGIAADQPNFGNTVASSFIFEVRYIPPSS